jgi:hypothetical protein
MRLGKIGVLGAVLLAVSPARSGETVSHQELGFRLTAPDGFVQAPERVQGKVVYAFQRAPTGDPKATVVIAVTRLGGTIGRERLDPKEVAARNPRVTLVTEKWKEFEIDVSRVPEEAGGVQLVTFNAQVPLKPEAIQVAVIGEADREAETRGVLRSVLANLDGPSNWLTAAERQSRLAEGITQLIITVCVLISIVVVVWSALRKRKTPRRE